MELIYISSNWNTNYMRNLMKWIWDISKNPHIFKICTNSHLVCDVMVLGNYVNSQQVWVLATMNTIISIRIYIVCHYAELLMAIIPDEGNTILSTTDLFPMASICTHDMEPLTAIYSNCRGSPQYGKWFCECIWTSLCLHPNRSYATHMKCWHANTYYNRAELM